MRVHLSTLLAGVVAGLAMMGVIITLIRVSESADASTPTVRTSYVANVRPNYDSDIRVVHVPIRGIMRPCVITDYTGAVAVDCDFGRES